MHANPQNAIPTGNNDKVTSLEDGKEEEEKVTRKLVCCLAYINIYTG